MMSLPSAPLRRSKCKVPPPPPPVRDLDSNTRSSSATGHANSINKGPTARKIHEQPNISPKPIGFVCGILHKLNKHPDSLPKATNYETVDGIDADVYSEIYDVLYSMPDFKYPTDCQDIFQNATITATPGAVDSKKSWCGICKQMIRDVSFLCAECNKILCKSCNVKHGQNDLFRDHKVIDPSNNISSMMGCKLHDNDPMKYFCSTCKLVICTVCAMDVEHGKHNKTPINDFKQVITDSIYALRECLKVKLEQEAPQVQKEQTNHTGIEESLNFANERIKICTENAIENIRKWEEDMLMALDNRHEKFRTWKSHTEKMQITHSNINSLVKSIDGKLQNKNNLQLVLDYKMMMSQGNDLIKPAVANNNAGVFEEVVFKQNDSVSFDLGSIATKGYYESIEKLKRTSITDSTYVTMIPKTEKRSVLWSVGIDTINQDLGSPPCVKFFPNDDVIIGAGKQLSLFDINGKKKAVFGSDNFNPAGIAVCSDDQFYVVNAKTKNIGKVDKAGTLVHTLPNTNFKCPRGLAISRRGNIVITDTEAHNVAVYSPGGRLMSRIGNRTFAAPVDVTVDGQGRIIFIDEGAQLIHIYDEDGNAIKTFWPAQGMDNTISKIEQDVKGVCCDRSNNICLALRGSDKIAKYSADGSFIEIALSSSDGINRPTRLAISNTGYLAVTDADPCTKHGVLNLYKLGDDPKPVKHRCDMHFTF